MMVTIGRGVVRGGATGAMAPPRFGWAMGHTHGTHPWPHLVLEAGPHLGQKPYYLPEKNPVIFENLTTTPKW